MTDITATGIRTFRQSRNLTQAQFAELLNTPLGTLKNWEQDRTEAPGCLAVALEVIETESPRKLVKELRERVADLEADLVGAWQQFNATEFK